MGNTVRLVAVCSLLAGAGAYALGAHQLAVNLGVFSLVCFAVAGIARPTI